MKIKTWIKYEDRYLPKGCRKFRYCECEDYFYAEIKSVKIDDLSLAFEDNSFAGKGKIYYYLGKLWSEVKMPSESILEYYESKGYNFKTSLDYLIYSMENCSKYFYSAYDRENIGIDTSRAAVVERVIEDMENYIIVNHTLYETTEEPRYVVQTFGLGHNHGGTGLLCAYGYNPNISKENYFSALDGEKAVAYANKIANDRGDSMSVGHFRPFIKVYMPEIVKVNPTKEHGDGDDFLKSIEEIISNSPDTLTASLLCIAKTCESFQ